MSKSFTKMTSREIQRLDEISVENYREWSDAQPDSPINLALRLTTRGLYDLQDTRTRLGNKCFAQFRSKLGAPPGERASEDDEDAEKKAAASVLKRLREEYKLVTAGAAKMITERRFAKNPGIFSSYTELQLAGMFVDILAKEESGFRRLKSELQKVEVYNTFLEPTPGVGLAMSAFLLSELNPMRARHASSFWKYLGMDVCEDGTGRSGKKIHMEPSWTRKRRADGSYVMRKVVRKTHRPKSKAKILGVLAPSLLKRGLTWEQVDRDDWEEVIDHGRRIRTVSGADVYEIAVCRSAYVERYLHYKHQKAHSVDKVPVYRKVPGRPDDIQLTEIAWKDTTPAHRNRAALRYMAKGFLADFWAAWRTSLGLPVSDPYPVAKLGMAPHGYHNNN